MKASLKRKILAFEELIRKVKDLKRAGKTVVQSHGVFDLIHPGVIKHFNSAKEQGDVLIVTVIKDKDARKGPGRSIFPENLRVENVASLSQVDYACIVDDENPFECVRTLNPHVFAKDATAEEKEGHIHKRVFKEENGLYMGKSRIHQTDGFVSTSSEIIKNFLTIYPDEIKTFLNNFSKRYSFNDVSRKIEGLQGLKVLLIGDGIIDEYHYCEAMGRATKAHLIVSRYLSHEVFAGGAFAIANHIAGLCGEIHLITVLGKTDSREDFISSHLKPNVTTKLFYREDGPTIVKKRYINRYLNQKLFEINYLDNNYISKDCEVEIIGYLKSKISEYDLVLVSDFGHGFITNRMIRVIESLSKKLAVNTQTNAANAGYNMIIKYRKPDYVCLDEPELRWAAQERFADIEYVARKVLKTIGAQNLIVTLGKNGSLGINRRNQVNRTPVFSTKVVDTVGAGDAFFAFTAPCLAKDMPLDLVSFIGNAVGALAVQIVCNKKPVEKYELLEFIHALLK